MTAMDWLDSHKPSPRTVWRLMIFDLLLSVAMFVFWIMFARAIFAVLCAAELISAWLAFCVYRIYSTEVTP